MRLLIPVLFLLSSMLCQAQRTVGLIQYEEAPQGHLLFAPMPSGTTYLIDACGLQLHEWTSTYRPGLSAQLLPDGSLLRTGNVQDLTWSGGGAGGILERFNWDGSLSWSYRIANDTLCQHHDVAVLPNGNFLVIAWDRKTEAEAEAVGRNPANVVNWLWSERVIELRPIGTDQAEVVWEWKLWDHLVQNFDPGLPNYAVPSTRPGRMNINFTQGSSANYDWIHLNSVDYDPIRDLILLSAHAMDEIWVIDHSTTTAEAAGTTGGNRGHGGDLLYRWGNPRAYGRGTVADQRSFGQHHATWLPMGHPDSGKILVFNNGRGRPGGEYSSIEILEIPVDPFGQIIVPPIAAFGPAAPHWTWTAPTPADFFATNISGVFPSGTGYLVTHGPEGRAFLLNAAEELVWQYVNPVIADGPVAQGTEAPNSTVFRYQLYPEDFSGFVGHDLTPGDEVELDPLPGLCLSLNMPAAEAEDVQLYPNPANATLSIGSPQNFVSAAAVDPSGRSVSLHVMRSSDRTELDVSSLAAGVYLLTTEDLQGERRLVGRFVVAR